MIFDTNHHQFTNSEHNLSHREFFFCETGFLETWSVNMPVSKAL